jgi:predicted dehydrogenase
MPNQEALLCEKGKNPRRVECPPGFMNGPETIYGRFADCVLRGGKPAVTLAEAAQTMRVLEDVRKASEFGTKGS